MVVPRSPYPDVVSSPRFLALFGIYLVPDLFIYRLKGAMSWKLVKVEYCRSVSPIRTSYEGSAAR